MSTDNRSSSARAAMRDDSPEAVLEYLHAHPDFFARHPEVLENLEVPHTCGKAVSLVEYQVSVLRDQARDLRRRVKDLMQVASRNEQLNRRVHRLTLGLLECRRAGEALDRLTRGLREDFSADAVAVRVFARPVAPGDADRPEFVGADAAAEAPFASVLGGGRTLCGRLKPEQQQYLFHDQDADLRSGVVLVLRASSPIGVLAIGSTDPGRFQPDMSTDLLEQLAGVISRILAPVIERGGATS